MLARKSLIFTMVVLASFVFCGLAAAQLTGEQELGKLLYFDTNLSINQNQSCASCHHPRAGFADPDQGIPVSRGSIKGMFGGRNAPSAAYAAFTPTFRWDMALGMYIGGQFWDGRADTLAAQAAGPPLNPVEMAMPDKWAVVDRLRTSGTVPGQPNYVARFMKAYKLDLAAIPAYDWAVPPAPNTPLPAGVVEIYDAMAKAIGEFEKTKRFTAFNSKFDYYLAGQTTLSAKELNGLQLFEGKGKCSLCHISVQGTAPDGTVNGFPPLFTDYTYDNLGMPANMKIPGAPLPPDLGLGGRPDIAAKDPKGLQAGKFKVMTLRNIALTAPYGHNGVFQTLGEIVHFYNTRDTLGAVCVDNKDPGFGTTCWPAPEVPQNMNQTELGNLALTAAEEAAIVAFLNTLTDGWGAKNGLPPLPRPPMPPMP